MNETEEYRDLYRIALTWVAENPEKPTKNEVTAARGMVAAWFRGKLDRERIDRLDDDISYARLARECGA